MCSSDLEDKNAVVTSRHLFLLLLLLSFSPPRAETLSLFKKSRRKRGGFCDERARFFFLVLVCVCSLPKKWSKTAIVYLFHKTDRDCVPFLHFYLAKIVNIDMRRVHALNTNLDRHERN